LRKTVSVVFCDLTGSTALGESLDPEALRGVLARYFDRMKAIVESHGGTVEKFIGDAVVAVFGVPVVHEDDALRACRAAVEMRDALPELGVRGRIGVNTGEVVTSTDDLLATGDAVNVAARLEQAARPGEVLIGEPTYALVRGAVEADPVEPLALKGKAEPVPALRLVSVLAVPERLHTARFVGRERELALVHAGWERARSEARCELVTVVGEAGVGKSRLVAEALALIDCRSVGGRCLPYGEGITYWPLVAVLKQLNTRPSDPAAAASIRSLLGESEEGTSAEEIAWGFRRLLEEQAPLVVLFDDIQWAEEAFLDLVEAAALLTRDAPLLLVCMARPELVERRPSWPVPVRLEPLPPEAAEELLPDTFDHELRARIARAAGGNPLFLTEMVAMASEADREVGVPGTLRALLAARLDQLEPRERSVLERGAVEGEIFHRGAEQALSADGPVTPRLAALVRKGLIRPDRAQVPGDDAFRFHHLLLRDAAYDALPKSVRAELHERFADWLEQHGAQLVELEELLGYHLEQAAGYRQELGHPVLALAERAGKQLTDAGRRALWRSDNRAAASLLERALALTRPLRLDVHIELDLASACAESAPGRAAAIAGDAAERARAAGDERGELLARVAAEVRRVETAEEPDIGPLETLARSALGVFEPLEDHAALVHVSVALGTVAGMRCLFEQQAQAAEQALRHARLAGQEPRHLLFLLEDALIYGPRRADDALRALEEALPENPPPRSLLNRALLLAMLGRPDEARSIAREANTRWGELAGKASSHELAEVERLTGDQEAATGYLRAFCDWCEEHEQRARLSTYAPMLGRLLCADGRYDEAEQLAERGRELGIEQDLLTQTLWRQAKALVEASRGEHAQAERLAREAVAISEQTDALNLQAEALCDLAQVLNAAGNTTDAADALEQALNRYERKRNQPDAAHARTLLEQLGYASQPPETGDHA
jgi:class 3 adenylate cyclase/tetratricopeptide (TPR) repeat protein